MALYVSSHPISWTERWCGKNTKKRKMATNENKKAKQSTRFIIFLFFYFPNGHMKRIKIFPKNIVDVYLQGMPLYPAQETQTIFLEQEMKKVKRY